MSVENRISTITHALGEQNRLREALRAAQQQTAFTRQPDTKPTGSPVSEPFASQLKILGRMTPEEVIAIKIVAGVRYMGQPRR